MSLDGSQQRLTRNTTLETSVIFACVVGVAKILKFAFKKFQYMPEFSGCILASYVQLIPSVRAKQTK